MTKQTKKSWEKELENIACWEVCCAGLSSTPIEETQYFELNKFIRKLLAKQREEIEKELLRVVRKPNDMSIGDSKDFKRGFRQGFEVCWMRVKAKRKRRRNDTKETI